MENTNGNQLRLQRLTVNNLFGVKIVDIPLNGKGAVLFGKNKQGKTSTIKGLLCGIGQLKDSNPVSNGEIKGSVVIETDKYDITKEWKNGRPNWAVKDKDGKRAGTPAELFKNFINDVTIAPHKFLNLPAKGKIKELCKTIGFDLDNHEKIRKDIYDERTAVGRDVKKAKGVLDALPKPEKDTPDEEISISELQAQLRQYQAKHDERREVSHKLSQANMKADGIDMEIKELKEKLASLEEERKEASKEKETLLEQLREMPDYNNQIADVSQKMENLEGENRKVRHKKDFEKAQKEYEELEQEYSDKSDEILRLDQELLDALNSNDLPEGLEIIDGELYMNKVPFDSLSTKEKLDLAMKIGMKAKANGEIYAKILTMDISQYDPDERKIAIELANANGFDAIWEIAGKAKFDNNGNPIMPEDLKDVEANVFYIEDGTATEMVDEVTQEV